MRFEILHTTDYRYSVPAIEAYLETRLTPPDTAVQSVLEHRMQIDPELPTSVYKDSFGNLVEFFSHTLRHDRLLISNRVVVETRVVPLPEDALGVPVAEARQVVASGLIDFFPYLQPCASVPLGGAAAEWVRRFFRPGVPVGKALSGLNEAIYEKFDYKPGSTTNATPLTQVWKQRRGVCQDFAHIMLSVLRTAGMPSRYVCGYIETDPPKPVAGEARVRRLVGSVATHAWVEVLVPGMVWVALDPTNKQWCGPRHVAVSFGRDSKDAAPVLGTFKGSGGQEMKVRVRMRRISAKS